MAPNDLPALTVGDVADIDGRLTVKVRTVGVDGATATAEHEVGAEGAVFVRTLVSFHGLTGGDDSTHLFATHRSDIIRPGFAFKLLTRPAEENDVQITDVSFGCNVPGHIDWLRRYGVKITHLDKISDVDRGEQ